MTDDDSNLLPLVLLEDEPVPGYFVDELGLRPFSTTVASAAIGTAGPFTIGVFGDWGQGKTSVLRQARSLIEASSNCRHVVTVWFNAWQYEKEDHSVLPLIASIVREIDRKRDEQSDAPTPYSDWWKRVTRALRSVAYGFSSKAKLKVPGYGELEASFVAKEMIDRYEQLRSEGDPLLDRSLYFNAFEALSAIAEPPDTEAVEHHPKIVVFIDDLDRCMPDQGLRLLESMKLVFAQRGFVFVLAVDRRIIDGYIEKRYREEFNVQDYRENSTSYLDKIVQLPLTLPPHQSRFPTYITELLKRPVFNLHATVAEAFGQLVTILADGSNYNPRSLVRFLNTLMVDRRIGELMGKGGDDSFLRLCATSRSLQHHLEHRDYRTLATDDQLCEAIAASDAPIQQRWSVETDNLEEANRKRVLQSLEQHAFLIKILDDPNIGTHWLTQHAARRSVDEFLDQRQSSLRSLRELEKLDKRDSTIIELVLRDGIEFSEVAKKLEMNELEAKKAFAFALQKLSGSV